MEHYIRFRSHKIDTSGLGTHLPTRRWRGSDYSDIAPYISGDDTRDISWKHSARSVDLQKKIRLEDGSFPISVINTIGSDSCFYTERDKKSPYQYAHEIVERISDSAKKYHFPIREFDSTQELEWSRNTMVFYITNGLESVELDTVRAISGGNDVIVIHIFHPYEISPTSSLIFRGLGLDTKRYIREFGEKRKHFQQQTYSIHASYLSLMTSDMPTGKLNQFFKNRFSL